MLARFVVLNVDHLLLEGVALGIRIEAGVCHDLCGVLEVLIGVCVRLNP